MKPTLIQRLKARLLVSGHQKKQGVAILTVLAIITLMTVLVVSFFSMAQSAQMTAKGSVEIQRVTTLKDTIINLVIAQFRESSKLTPTNAGDPRSIITWTSQPGGIRTYSGTEPKYNKLFKLYSSSVPQLDGILPGKTDDLLKLINEDIVPDWAERPDEYTDLNRPVYTAATGDRARATGADDAEGYSYPIADPRAYNGNSDPQVNTEGFTYSQKSLNKIVRGVDPQKAQLAMPVRWIYQLQDGTLGYLNDSQEFTSLSGKGGGEVNHENPIVGRLAWWADDESCKINVNTASVPAIWDTPRTTSKEDVWLARSQPLSGEYQRYPGHPATVDLSAVFFPGRRYVYADSSFKMTPGGKMLDLGAKEANLIWDLAPFVVGTASSGEYGTAGGVLATPASKQSVDFEPDDHLFTSLDEVYFKASGATNKSMDSARENLETQGKDPRGELLERLERAQFFITHKSHSPELTNQGFPRISMFPMADDARALVANPKTQLPATGEVSPYDVTMALNSTINKLPYYFQREDPNSRHAEFYINSLGRNVAVFRYLKELSKLPIPGYPQGFPGAYPFKLSAPVLTEDPDGLSLASKYPPGINPLTNSRYLDSGKLVTNGSTLLDASDRTQILLNMLDYTRSLNMQPAFLSQANRYDDGNGQASPLCGCGSTGDHPNACAATVTLRVPKGAGKVMNPSEIAVVINIAAKKTGNATQGEWAAMLNLMAPNSPSRTLANSATNTGTLYMVEIGFIMGAFNPKMGWSPVNQKGGIVVASNLPSSGDAPFSAPGTLLPIISTLDGKVTEQLSVAAAAGMGGVRLERTALKNMLSQGGMLGPRGQMPTTAANARPANSWAICSPICISKNEDTGSLQVPLQVDPSIPLRIMVLEETVGGGNTIMAADLRLPSNFLSGVTATYTGKSLGTMANQYANAALPFPDPRTVTRSFVIPSGDYRQSTALRMDGDFFVAHQGYTGAMAHSFFESNVDPALRKMNGATYSPLTLVDAQAKPAITQLASVVHPPALPLPAVDPADLALKQTLLYASPDPDSTTYASQKPDRRSIFGFGRRDGNGKLAKRGSSDPDETGDFDNGIAAAEDGPYMNYPDEGDRRQSSTIPYFVGIDKPLTFSSAEKKTAQSISPNFLVRSPVDFGSIPTGLQSRVPWQTLRFRPDPGMNDPSKAMKGLSDLPPPGLPFANFCGPRDHFFLDMFWMPVVEPYSISEPFSTKGTINLNQQIFPFLYINRTTALHALLRGERMLAIPNDAAAKYKRTSGVNGQPNNDDDSYRYFINAEETVKQFLTRYNSGLDAEGQPLAFNSFRSASEICEMWLVPDKNGNTYDGSQPWDLEYIVGTATMQGRTGFWPEHRLTGDNSRERPYANLYPRVTVRSNVFKLHLVAQTLQKARSTDPLRFDSTKDIVSAEWRGSCMIERTVDPRDTKLNVDYTNLNSKTIQLPKLDRYYTYRVTEVKQLTQ